MARVSRQQSIRIIVYIVSIVLIDVLLYSLYPYSPYIVFEDILILYALWLMHSERILVFDKPPDKFNIMKNHTRLRWFDYYVLICMPIICLLAVLGALILGEVVAALTGGVNRVLYAPMNSFAGMTISLFFFLGTTLLSLGALLYLLIRWSSFSVEIVAEADGIELKKNLKWLINSMILNVPFFVVFSYLPLGLFIAAVSYFVESLSPVLSFIVRNPLSLIIIALLFYALYIEIPTRIGRRRWKEKELKRLYKARSCLTKRVSSIMKGKHHEKRISKVNLELELLANQNLVDDVRRSQNYPYGITAIATSVLINVFSFLVLSDVLLPFLLSLF